MDKFFMDKKIQKKTVSGENILKIKQIFRKEKCENSKNNLPAIF
jgi:hypothetical protein